MLCKMTVYLARLSLTSYMLICSSSSTRSLVPGCLISRVSYRTTPLLTSTWMLTRVRLGLVLVVSSALSSLYPTLSLRSESCIPCTV
ncbi:hypothetical protein BDU57DRAFT_525058 [Ampelomyces quisqualis]|uniref:Uncharacterized protein n=1 Tax=Ampelomyces quisqualis TaxID=50730 RepID=A0A6A5Q5M9_AMPQU|nr:hypothetical protein BDU57DRAFT_525058 [Ampelomyces quisqualis]